MTLTHAFLHTPNPKKIVNTSHIVNHLSFGMDYPGLKNPLDGEMKILDEGTGTFE